jgi:hypothetical protein
MDGGLNLLYCERVFRQDFTALCSDQQRVFVAETGIILWAGILDRTDN